MTMQENANFHDALIGQTVKSVHVTDEVIMFHMADGHTYKMYHEQECCEDVYVEDVVGEWDDIIGFPLVIAEESSNSTFIDPRRQTWTFYRLVTERGAVTIRWFGQSNGYYSESVDFCRVS